MGLRARLRRRDRPLVRQRSGQLLVVARDPHRRRARPGAGAAVASTRSTTSTSTAASRAPCRSAPTCSAFRSTIRARSPSPAACPTTAARATTTAPTPSPAWSSGCAPTPGEPRPGHRRRLVSDQARGRRLLERAARRTRSRATIPQALSARGRRRAASRAGRGRQRRRRRSKRTPCSTTATATRRVGIVVARLADGRRCWANITDPDVLERIEREEFIGPPARCAITSRRR